MFKACENNATLIVIGSGISGIMTAWQAVQAGYQVQLFSKSPDPRTETRAEVDKESSTFDSKNDQRYVTLFEGHPYLEHEGYVNKVYPNIARDFETCVLEGGILVKQLEQFGGTSRQWLRERSELNARLLAKDENEMNLVAALFDSYTQENRAAMEQWFEIMTKLIRRAPELLADLSLHANGIIRLYDSVEVFNQSLVSHQKEQMLIKQYTPGELVQSFPAYKEGVKKGFIAGGAIEVYALTFAVGTFCRAILNELEEKGVSLNFGIEVETIMINQQDQVEGIKLFGQSELQTANHYACHTGAFAGPELFKFIPPAQNKLAAVEGYWFTIENAETIVAAMGGKPNKVHGKMSLNQVLGMIESNSAAAYRCRFEKMGIDSNDLDSIAPIVDFNNMPIFKGGKNILGVGSGYVFKGICERGGDGKVVFHDNAESGNFVLTVMELWLEALHGKELLSHGELIVHPTGCKRSYTPNDQELDVNLPTVSGGVCMIHDGGNTGSTTKSPFISNYMIEKMKLTSQSLMNAKTMANEFLKLRQGLRKTAIQVPTRRWQILASELNCQIEVAQQLNSLKFPADKASVVWKDY